MATLKHISLGLVLLLSGLVPDAPQKETQGPLTGTWRAKFFYPQNDGRDPVGFRMVVIQDGSTIAGFIKEPNTFGRRREPFLHAIFKGKIEDKTGKVTFIKTYDGTGGESHDVEYTGQLGNQGAKIDGTWDIQGFGGDFTAIRLGKNRAGHLSGVWTGTYHYPDEKKLEPVKFHMLVIHEGDRITGLVKEPNTFGDRKDEPNLHAAFRGRVDEKTGKITFIKSYDGTGGEDHDVEYTGQLAKDGLKAEGTWEIPGDITGRFTMQKQKLDQNTLDGLK